MCRASLPSPPQYWRAELDGDAPTVLIRRAKVRRPRAKSILDTNCKRQVQTRNFSVTQPAKKTAGWAIVCHAYGVWGAIRIRYQEGARGRSGGQNQKQIPRRPESGLCRDDNVEKERREGSRWDARGLKACVALPYSARQEMAGWPSTIRAG
jgi:hypothetical protein